MVVLLYSSSLNMEHSFGAHNDKVVVIFRYDDFGPKSDMLFNNELFYIFSRLNIPLTIGVIPFINNNDQNSSNRFISDELSSEKLELLARYIRLNSFEIALHGVSHIINSSPGDEISEFKGIKMEDQYKMISSGKEYLENKLGTKINTFIPPWNSYDSETVKVLEKLNIRTISAGSNRILCPSTKLNFLPRTCTIPAIKKAVDIASQIHGEDSVIVVIFHSYDFKGINNTISNKKLSEFVNTLTWLSEQENITFKTIDQVIADGGDYGFDRNRRYIEFYNSTYVKYLPNKEYINSRLRNIYPSSNSLNIIKGKLHLIIALHLILLLAALLCVGYVLSRLLLQLGKR